VTNPVSLSNAAPCRSASAAVTRLDHRVAIVTGAAEGLGKGIAEALVQAGASVGLLDRNVEVGQETTAKLARAGDADCVFAACDISREEQVIEAVEHVANTLGPPTILVNNAGIFIFKGVDATVEEWQEIMSVNIMGPALVTKHVVAHMRRAGGGSIVNIGSVSAFIAQKGFLTYSATKAAVVEMTRCMALDLAEDEIRVNSVSPGAVWSASMQRAAQDLSLTREAAAREPNFGFEQIIQRSADPIEIGRAVVFLASDDASFITGANLAADGGWTAV
jgi:NAD(P)-dependent dehydrogenase (short-subunit alcohol dehydrogenase family)